MNPTALSLRFRWLQLSGGLFFMLLQRAPAPMLRVLAQFESLVIDEAPVILRSGVALAAMGAYNSVAGATVFNVTATPTAAVPTSGAAKTTFDVTEPSSTPVSVAVSVSGAPGNPKSYSVSGALPAGLSLTGATGSYVNVVAPYKMTIAGTPTAAGSFPVRITAWDGLNGTGGNSAYITVNFTITGGVSAVAPSITTQPTSQTVTAGGSASFTVAASGTPAPTYQWQKGGVNIAGATSTTLTLSNVQSGDAGNYTAVATNSAGSATSNLATLTVQAAPPASTAPSITTQPTSQTVTAGGSASFTVAASGNPAPTYQWQKGGVNIAGATSTTLTLSNVQSGDAGNYTAV
ncbi:MAG: immunoglobulin domain-containing protein, partial [Opitutae bacterium]|nr:immunoglobulin domain-containing protein [Opitutae bacterium]